jgi:NhaA family Na+:H+ antiporter
MTRAHRLLSRGSFPEAQRVTSILRSETVGGALLLIAAVGAFVWANSPWSDTYSGLRDTRIGPVSLQLDLTLGSWAADGLLAIFFFVAGLELKREFVAGDLREFRRAVLPVGAAVGGMAVPALFFVLFNLGGPDGALRGWAIPSATDIAFALAVLAVISTHLPSALRTFLLTLAVVDDLLAIVVIAIFYTTNLAVVPLVLTLLTLGIFCLLVQRGVRSPWLLIPLAVLTWALMHRSGVHATVAGVLLAFTVPVGRGSSGGAPDTGSGLAEHFEHRLRPLSAGFAVPLFAFFSAGVTVGGFSGLGAAMSDSIALGIIVGLIAGKTLGIAAATWLISRFTPAQLDERLGWPDVVGLAMLGGIGFTVSLLVTDLAYGVGTVRYDHAKVGILVGTTAAALLASIALRLRNRRYRRIILAEQVDLDDNGIPDVYEQGPFDAPDPDPATATLGFSPRSSTGLGSEGPSSGGNEQGSQPSAAGP